MKPAQQRAADVTFFWNAISTPSLSLHRRCMKGWMKVKGQKKGTKQRKSESPTGRGEQRGKRG